MTNEIRCPNCGKHFYSRYNGYIEAVFREGKEDEVRIDYFGVSAISIRCACKEKFVVPGIGYNLEGE